MHADGRPARRRLAGHWGVVVLIGLLCLVVGAVAGRPDVAALGGPFILLAGAGLNQRSASDIAVLATAAGSVAGSAAGSVSDSAAGSASDSAAGSATYEDGSRRMELAVQGSGAVAIVSARTPGRQPIGVALDSAVPDPAILTQPPLSGHAVVLAYTYTSLCYFGVTDQEAVPGESVALTVLPPVTRVPALPLPARLRGLTGEHQARSQGDGGELRGIHPFQTGDQLRRIDWKATARQSTDQDRIHVRRTFATAEASVMLSIDTAADFPSRCAQWFEAGQPVLTDPSSLHLAREAATVTAASYLNRGDRVGLCELSGFSRPLRVSSGRRQLELIRARLAQYRAVPRAERPRQDQGMPPDALIIVASPFMDDEPLRLLQKWHRLGHRVIGVDTLPRLSKAALDPSQQAAVRLALLQRRTSLLELEHDGVTVLGWRGPESPGQDDSAGGLDVLPGQLGLTAGLAMLQRSFARSRNAPAGRPW